MNRTTECIAWAIASLAVAGATVIFGMNLLPPPDAVANRLGTAVPLYLTWGMIWMVVVAAIVLAGFLLTTGLKQRP